MSKIIKNPDQINPVALPQAEIFLFGRGQVSFSWKFTRKVPFWFLYYNSEPGAVLKFSGREIRPDGRHTLHAQKSIQFSVCFRLLRFSSCPHHGKPRTFRKLRKLRRYGRCGRYGRYGRYGDAGNV